VSLIVDIDIFDKRYSRAIACQQMLVANISLSISSKSFTLFLNRDLTSIINTLFPLLLSRKLLIDCNANSNIIISARKASKKKQILIVTNKKSIKKNKKDNNKNLKLVDQLISKNVINNIAN